MTKTIITAVASPAPSHVTDDAVDLDAMVAICDSTSITPVVAHGHVTFVPDHVNGGMVPIGDSIDCWMSREIHDAVLSIKDADARRQAIIALSSPGHASISGVES